MRCPRCHAKTRVTDSRTAEGNDDPHGLLSDVPASFARALGSRPFRVRSRTCTQGHTFITVELDLDALCLLPRGKKRPQPAAARQGPLVPRRGARQPG